MNRAFDPQTVDVLDREREVDIITRRPDGTQRRTTIWVVVDEGEAFIRSWRGAGAHWYRAAVDRPTDVNLIAGDRRLPVRPVPATDDLSIARCSSALERKYAGDSSTESMVDEEILDTTLRLEPR